MKPIEAWVGMQDGLIGQATLDTGPLAIYCTREECEDELVEADPDSDPEYQCVPCLLLPGVTAEDWAALMALVRAATDFAMAAKLTAGRPAGIGLERCADALPASILAAAKEGKNESV